jgi:hypothetical protein
MEQKGEQKTERQRARGERKAPVAAADNEQADPVKWGWKGHRTHSFLRHLTSETNFMCGVKKNKMKNKSH